MSQVVEPWYSIPVQRFKVVAHRVHGVLASNDLDAAPDYPHRHGNSLLLEPFAGADIVVVGPLLHHCAAPRWWLWGDRPSGEHIVGENAVPFRCIAKCVECVAQVTQRGAAVVQHQAVEPVISRLEGQYHAAHREIPGKRLLCGL